MIIFINGSINSGKSTIARLLCKKIPRTALIEIDALREFIDWFPIEQAVPINLKNAVSIIRNLSNHKINSVIPYPLSEENYKFLVEELEELEEDIKIFTLAPRESIALNNRGNRELSDWEKSRVKHHYKIGVHKLKYGEILDNSDQTPDETVSEILSLLEKP